MTEPRNSSADLRRSAWESAAAAILRRQGRLAEEAADATVWETLAVRSIEGLPIPALGDRSDGPPPIFGARRSPDWDIRSLIAESDPRLAADAILDELGGGATSVLLAIGAGGTELADLERVLDGVYLDAAPVVPQAGSGVSEAAAAVAMAELLDRRAVTPAPRSCLGADPIGRTLNGDSATTLSADVVTIAAAAEPLGVRGFVVDASRAHDRGAGDAAELGYALGLGVGYLRLLATAGFSIDQSLQLLEFRFAVTADQFLGIAKLRAARQLWQRVADLCGGAPTAGVQHLHAVTSRPMLTRYDPWVNLLRGTSAAFAAGVAGADVVTVLPMDSALGIPDRNGRRLARNISSLLISESHVGITADPAAGAAAIEQLTAEFRAAGWAEFQRIESAGGIQAAIADGSLLASWSKTAAERSRRVAHREQPLTGVSEFPNLDELLLDRRPAPDASIRSWAQPFQELRDDPPSVPVFLATLGPVAAHAGPAGDAQNLLAAGGVRTVGPGATSSVEEVIAAFRAARTPVACLAGTSSAYAADGAAVVAALRAAGARWVLAARPGDQLAGLCDDEIKPGQDAVELLVRLRRALHNQPTEVSV